jgi:hypothetical protein
MNGVNASIGQLHNVMLTIVSALLCFRSGLLRIAHVVRFTSFIACGTAGTLSNNESCGATCSNTCVGGNHHVVQNEVARRKRRGLEFRSGDDERRCGRRVS